MQFTDNFFKREIRDGFEISEMMKRADYERQDLLRRGAFEADGD